MNTKLFNNRILAGVALAATLFIGSSCEDNMGLQITDEAPDADKTLYEIIKNDDQLTDFCDVLTACNLDNGFDVADSLFNKSRVYTLWAPINGSFKKDSVIKRVNDGYRDDVMRTFVNAHVANHLRQAKGLFEEEELVLMLNDKMVPFSGSYKEGYTFGEGKLYSWNYRAKNGLLHKLELTAEYKYNIWEYLWLSMSTDFDNYKVDALATYLYSFNDTTFSESLSIPGPIVDGKETYLDSVNVISNMWLNAYNGVGLVDSEDSLYTIYVPTNDEWDRMLTKARSHFNYLDTLPTNIAKTVEKGDSIKEHHTKYNLVKFLTYSDNEQKFVSPDSMIPANRSMAERPTFLKEDLNANVVYEKALSNGTFKIVNKFPYDIFDLWHDTIKIEGEDASMRHVVLGTQRERVLYVSEKDLNEKYAETGMDISGTAYYEAYSVGNDVQLQYKVPNVRSASYNIALVTVPKDVTTEYEEKDLLDLELKCTIMQKNQIFTCMTDEAVFKPAKDRLDTLFLPDPDDATKRAVIRFPKCEYYNSYNKDDFNANIIISSQAIGTKKEKTILLDAILLIPVEDAE